MKCEICQLPINHVRVRYTKARAVTTFGIIIAGGLYIVDFHFAAFTTSVVTNLWWAWEQ